MILEIEFRAGRGKSVDILANTDTDLDIILIDAAAAAAAQRAQWRVQTGHFQRWTPSLSVNFSTIGRKCRRIWLSGTTIDSLHGWTRIDITLDFVTRSVIKFWETFTLNWAGLGRPTDDREPSLRSDADYWASQVYFARFHLNVHFAGLLFWMINASSQEKKKEDAELEKTCRWAPTLVRVSMRALSEWMAADQSWWFIAARFAHKTFSGSSPMLLIWDKSDEWWAPF